MWWILGYHLAIGLGWGLASLELEPYAETEVKHTSPVFQVAVLMVLWPVALITLIVGAWKESKR